MVSNAVASRTVRADTAAGSVTAPMSAEVADPFPQRSLSLQNRTLSRPLRARKSTAGGGSPRTEEFRHRFFPDATLADWNDWRWQIRNRFCTAEDIGEIISLSAEESAALCDKKQTLPFAITPHYASLLDKSDSTQPIRRAVIPVLSEHTTSPGESTDPLDEAHMCPVDNLVHRYPDRVLFLVTPFCSTYCRYCTRSRMVGDLSSHGAFSLQNWEKAIGYIAEHTEIRDVLISGGDPLTLPDEPLEWLLAQLRKIKHVEIVRIGTKAPVVLPQRITPALVRMLRKFHPLFMSIHFMHPDEMTAETRKACEMLADAGIPLGSQTVLLSGINDTPETMTQLMHKLLGARVRPYYIYQCDPIAGSAHFRTPVQRGIDIIRSMRGFTSGYAIPHFVIDAPGGGGKIPLSPDYIVGSQDGALLLRNYEGRIFSYPDYSV